MFRWYRACSISALTDRRRLRGQISTFLILVMVVILIFTFAVVNLGQVSAMSTTVANAADTAALNLGSQLATKAMIYRETFSKTKGGRHKDGNTRICIHKGWLLEALPYILAIVAMANPGVNAALGSGVLAAANAGAIGGALSGVIKYGNLKGAVVGAAMGFAAGASVGYAWQSFGARPGAGNANAVMDQGWADMEQGIDIGSEQLFQEGAAIFQKGMLLAAPAVGSAMTGALLSTASGTYNAVVQQRMQSNAINAAMKSLNGLSEEDRIKESVIFNALSMAVDDPTMVPDTNDFNGDGSTTDEIPKFLTWWDTENVQKWRASESIAALIKEYVKNGKTDKERGPVAKLRLALRQAVHNKKDDHRMGGILAVEELDKVPGLLSRLDLEARIKEHPPRFRFREGGNDASFPLSFLNPNGPTGLAKWRACQQKLEDDREKNREDNEDDDTNAEEPPVIDEPLDPNDVDPCGRPEGWDEVDETNFEFKGFVQVSEVLLDKSQLKRLTETWEDWLPIIFYEPMERRPAKPKETDAEKAERQRVANEEKANPELLLERDPLMRLVDGFDESTDPKKPVKFIGIKSWRAELTTIATTKLPPCKIGDKIFDGTEQNANKITNWPCRVQGAFDPQATSDRPLRADPGAQYVTDSNNQKKPGLNGGKCGTLEDLKQDPAPEDADVCEGELLRADAALAKLQEAIEVFHTETDKLMKDLRYYQAQLELDYTTCKDPNVPSTCKAQKPPSTLTYDWVDSRGKHSVTATVGPFTVPWIQGYTRTHVPLGMWSSRCWRIRSYKSDGKTTWVKVTRKDPAEQQAGPWWVWNPHKGETMKVAHVKYNARPAYYVRGWEKARDWRNRRDNEVPRVALTEAP